MRSPKVQVLLVNLSVVVILSSHTKEKGFKLVYHQEQLTHSQASDACTSHGGTLPIVKDHIVQEILADVPLLRHVSIWVGLTNINDTWTWNDGTLLTPENIGTRLPIFGVTESSSCGSIVIDTDSGILPTDCTLRLPFFCQYESGTCFYREYPESSVVGHNIFQMTVTNRDTCKDVCCHVTEFKCESFEYSDVNKFCQMNDVNRWTASENFVYFDRSWDYYHKSCYSSTLVTEDSDQYTSISYISTTAAFTSTVTSGSNRLTASPRHYILSNISLSWTDAVQYCKAHGGLIAVIDGPSVVPETGYQAVVDRDEVFWIGANRIKGGDWEWYEYGSLKWSNFKYKPNKFDFIKVCAVVSLYNGWWYDDICSEKRRFICQYTTDSCEFIKKSNASIIAHNTDIISNISRTACEVYCSEDKTCRSYEYNYFTRTCQMSVDNKWTVSKYYHEKSYNWTYFHKRCNFGYDPVVESTTEMTTTDLATTGIDTTTLELTTELTTEDPKVRAEVIFNEAKSELQEIGKKLKQKRLEKSKTSAVDNRPSAKGVGIAASIILISIFGSIVLLDISTVGAQCQQFSGRRKRRSSRYRNKNVFQHKLGSKTDLISPENCTIKVSTGPQSSILKPSISEPAIFDTIQESDKSDTRTTLHATEPNDRTSHDTDGKHIDISQITLSEDTANTDTGDNQTSLFDSLENTLNQNDHNIETKVNPKSNDQENNKDYIDLINNTPVTNSGLINNTLVTNSCNITTQHLDVSDIASLNKTQSNVAVEINESEKCVLQNQNINCSTKL